MLSFPQFLLESSICLLVFYLFYYWVLRKETFFQLNRIYLLASPLLAILIPVLNIQLQQPTATTSASFETIFYPAVSNAQYVNELIWQQIERPTPAFSLTIGDILLIAYILGVLYMTVRLTNGMLGLFRLIAKSQVRKSKGYSVVETETEFPASSFFSYVFWNANNMTDEQRLIFEHELVHIRQKHSFDVLLMEFWVIIKWYNPLIYLYRNALQVTHEYIADNYVSRQAGSVYQYANLLVKQSQEQACHNLLSSFSALVKKRLVMLGQHQSAWYKGIKYVLSIPLFVGMMLLFSFNLVEEIPDNPISASLTNLEHYLEDFGDKTLLEIEKEHPYEQYLEWGGVEFPLVRFDESREIKIDIRNVTPIAFEQIKNHSFKIRQLYEENAIESFEIVGEFADGNSFHCSDDLQCFYENIDTSNTEFTLYFKLRDTTQKEFCSVISISNSNQFQQLKKENNLYEQVESFEYFCKNPSIQSEDLRLQGQNQYYLEWGNRKFQAIKSGNPLKEPFDIQSLSLEEMAQLQEENFSMVYNNSCLLIDSVYTTVTDENGKRLHCKDQWKDDACYRSFLHEVDDNSTVYLVIKTKLGDVFSSVISVGEEATLYFENEDFYSEMLQYTNFPITDKKLKVLPPSHYELLWGGLKLDLKKSSLNGAFEGTIEVSKEDFVAAIDHEPVLSLANGNTFDDLTFDVSALYEYTATNQYFGSVESYSSNPDSYKKGFGFPKFETDLKAGSKILLQNIRYDDRTVDEIEATIHITSVAPKLIAQKMKRLNWYQFHWGDIDVKIKETEVGKFEHFSTQISIEDFKKSIELEPVLTSRKEGVLFDFELDVAWKNEAFGIKSLVNNPDAYLNSFDIKKLQNGLTIGDTVLVRRISTADINDVLEFKIHITEPSNENIRTTKYKDKVVLDWGDYEFPIRQLNADKKDASQIPVLTLQPDFFKSLVCDEARLYHKGQALVIKEAAVLIKEKGYQENCKIDNWSERDCFTELLENACEESQISLFFKTSAKKNYMLQFRLSAGLDKEEIGFGQDTTQVFNELLEDYTKVVYERKKIIQAQSDVWSIFKTKNAKLFLGELEFDLEKDNHSSSFNFVDVYSKEKLTQHINKSFRLEIDGEKFPLTNVFAYNNNNISENEHPRIFSLTCKDGECFFEYEDVNKFIEVIHTLNMISMNFMITYDLFASYRIANLSLNTDGITGTSGWNPSIKPLKLKTDAAPFQFQMVNRGNRHTLVRMDTTNQKYAWMVESYKDNPSVEVIHIDGFKTHQRVLEDKQAVVPKTDIKKVDILTKNSLNPFEYPDFHAFEEKTIALHWRDFRGNSWDMDFYCLEDFKKAKGDLIFSIDGVAMPIIQFDAHIIQEDGTTTKFISDRPNKKEIDKAIRKMDDRTTIAFDELLIETPTGMMRFPLRFLFYLE